MKSDGYNADAEKVEKANSKLNPRKGVDEVEKVDLARIFHEQREGCVWGCDRVSVAPTGVKWAAGPFRRVVGATSAAGSARGGDADAFPPIRSSS